MGVDALASGTQALLVIFSGVPGTGKTTLAERAADWLRAPVFSKDELEATLWRSGIGHDAKSGWAAYELMTTLAGVQLRHGQSVILDSVATTQRIRASWRELAAMYDVPVRVVETICSDANVHRARLETRRRSIPGWPELSWQEVLAVAANFESWADERLILDAAQPLEGNLRALSAFLLEGRPVPTPDGSQRRIRGLPVQPQ